MTITWWRTRVNEAVASTEPRDIHLWLLVLLAMSLDIALTIYGLRIGLIERNPIVLFSVDMIGYSMLAFLKVPAIGIGFVGWFVLPKPARRLNLIGLSLPWFMAASVNAWLILQELGI